MPPQRQSRTRILHIYFAPILAALVLASCENATENKPPVNVGQSLGAGCVSAAANGLSTSEFGCGLLQSTGIPSVDQAITQEVPILRNFFSAQQYAVYFFDECDPANANAYASSKGYVIFGRYFAQMLYQPGSSTLPHLAFLAHEFGHAHQYVNGWLNLSGSQRTTELEADAFAGFYVALAKNWAGLDIDTYYKTLFNYGDFYFNSPSHHGTPIQRYAAGGLGLGAALYAVQNNFTPTPQQLHTLFIDRITNCIVQLQDPSPCIVVSAPPVAGGVIDPEVRKMASRLDNELIRGLAMGERSIREIPALPRERARVALNNWMARASGSH